MKKKLLAVLLSATMLISSAISVIAAEPIYFNDFENGVGEDCTIVGTGAIEEDANANFGGIFHNAIDSTDVRSNYLLLPSDVLAQSSETKQLTISFWVNVGTATDYWFSPIFSAYNAEPGYWTEDGNNTWPVLVLQSRLLAQVNCNGWSDFAAAQNLAGANKETTVWLDDAEWHFYTAVFDDQNVKLYVDGVIQNEWDTTLVDGTSLAGLYSNGYELTYVCLGGNQAWEWGDKDAQYLFDDVAIYNTALTADDISMVMLEKKLTTIGAQTNGAADKLAFITTVDKDLIDDEEVEELGVLLVKGDTANVTLDDVDGTTVIKGATSYVTTDTDAGADDDNYAFRTIINGPAVDDTYTAVPYMVLADGTEVYGDACSRSIADVQ